MKPFDVRLDPPHGGEEAGLGGRVGGGQRGSIDEERFSRDGRAVDPTCVVEQRRQPFGLHVAADSFDHLTRREGLTEDVDGPLAAGWADQFALRRELGPQSIQPLPPVGRIQIDPLARLPCRRRRNG